jgi:hypothetical protein
VQVPVKLSDICRRATPPNWARQPDGVMASVGALERAPGRGLFATPDRNRPRTTLIPGSSTRQPARRSRC